jgi:putative ATP-dependent endonuclease of the OLD family
MRLVSFSVQNYRSITTAHKIKVGRSTVILGPNNEGKSNVIRGLITAMRILKAGTRSFAVRSPVEEARRLREGHHLLFRPSTYDIYEWENDYPVSLQDTNPEGESVFIIEFELDESEIAAFYSDVGSQVNGTLPLRLAVGHRKINLTVSKRGPGAKTLSRKAGLIANFIVKRLEFEYIEAVRTARSAERVVDSLVENQLRTLETSDEYRQAIALIDRVQKPVLDTLSKSIKETLVKFLPAIVGVTFDVTQERRFTALRRSAKMIIDDGTPTSLEYKGDGVQSLAALALMRHSSESDASGKHFIIAVEEPESHLHPNAMHELKLVLQELADRHQVVITTHSPVFVDRSNLVSNIIVKDGKARAAKSIDEIRDTLGVKASDNLRHAELVLIVEGADDSIALRALLCAASSVISSAFKQGLLAIDTLGGGTNLSYKTSQVKQALCQYHCFLDNDECGRRSFQKAQEEGLVAITDVNFANCQGRRESELEDLYDIESYRQFILDTYGVSLDSPKFKGRDKWSVRIAQTFEGQGKPWNDGLESELKMKLANFVAATPDAALNPHTREPFDAFVTGLETRITRATKGRVAKKHRERRPAGPYV